MNILDYDLFGFVFINCIVNIIIFDKQFFVKNIFLYF